VTRIVIDPISKIATSVEYMVVDGVTPPSLRLAKARKEIVLSSGAMNSPKLLMLSGVGPKNELEKHQVGRQPFIMVSHTFASCKKNQEKKSFKETRIFDVKRALESSFGRGHERKSLPKASGNAALCPKFISNQSIKHLFQCGKCNIFKKNSFFLHFWNLAAIIIF
jgi:GMC oxidoreductase